MQVQLILAHADDETLGAGGTVRYLLSRGHEVRLIIVSDAVVTLRSQIDDNGPAWDQACDKLGLQHRAKLNFQDQRFETYPVAEIAHAIHQELDAPDLIITHSDKDLNRDHRIVREAVNIVSRPRSRRVSVLACEIPAVATWNQQPFAPNFYVGIEPYLPTKLEAFSCYGHELREMPDPYSLEGLEHLAAFRGMESGYRYAEGFEVVRWFAECSL
ncbi:PIG-L family deacetylase [Pontibacter sp. G13]|uniref:PIG-L deacetylase family protein n=1 Tax=Pontibacter sp. G13 TaxID=3074898 RepID=UPI0028894926|nr:PIG-L family deacetylase [Pontibacter sp. G13]WNJ16274.1 PIG-L family deacetylase [Pontibacter sp. G13]